MAFEQYKSSNAGDDQEIVDTTAYLKKLKSALDAGEVTVSEFLKYGQPVANSAAKKINALASSNSAGANVARPYYSSLLESGFVYDMKDGQLAGARPQLGQQYQQALREELVPTNLDPEARNRIISSIPDDIDFFSDQGKIERERIRQQVESEKALTARKGERQTKLDELAGLLSSRRDTLQDRAIPQITEKSNAAGQLDTTAYGQAIAKNLTQLEEDSQYALSAQSLSDRDVNMAEALDILNRSQQFQTAALERTFSREDQSRSQDFAMRLAELSKPTQPSKSSAEKWLNGASVAINGAQAASGFVK